MNAFIYSFAYVRTLFDKYRQCIFTFFSRPVFALEINEIRLNKKKKKRKKIKYPGINFVILYDIRVEPYYEYFRIFRLIKFDDISKRYILISEYKYTQRYYP